jgi:hypothetical protein
MIFDLYISEKIAIGNLFLNQNIKEAIEEPRLHHQLTPDIVSIEEGITVVGGSFLVLNLKNIILITSFLRICAEASENEAINSVVLNLLFHKESKKDLTNCGRMLITEKAA